MRRLLASASPRVRAASSSAALAVRPRRSALYIPGSNARALEKARTLAADVLILDLEDAVAPEKKTEARSQVAEAVASGGYGGSELVVRVNSLGSQWGSDDLRAASAVGADAILLPKVESVEAVEAARVEAGGCQIWCMIETPIGVLRAETLASHAAVSCLVAGTSDLATDLRCDGAWEERAALMHSLSHIVLAARAHGIAALDGVHLDLKDLPGLERSCVQGRALGFDGKTLIHPSTLEAANRVYAPSDSQIEHARRVVSAFEQAAAAGSALAVVDGKLVESLHVREAERLLAMAEVIEARARAADT